MRREIALKTNEIETLKRDQNDQIEQEDSRYYSPKIYRKMKSNDKDPTISDSKTNYSLKGVKGYTTNRNEFDGNQTLNKVDTSLSNIKRNTKRLKSSSPTRNNILGSNKQILGKQFLGNIIFACYY